MNDETPQRPPSINRELKPNVKPLHLQSKKLFQTINQNGKTRIFTLQNHQSLPLTPLDLIQSPW
jgi:hypothetical protein